MTGQPRTTTSTGEWLAVSTEGFAEQQRGRPFGHLVKELVQNALDGVGDDGRIELDVAATGPGTARVRCADDGTGAPDLSRLNVVFVTDKKDGVTKRGRMGRGFKEMLSIATQATVSSCGERLEFTVAADGTRTVAHTTGLHWRQGFEVMMDIVHDAAGDDVGTYFQGFIVPAGVRLVINGKAVAPRPATHVVEARLTTERFANGRWEKPQAATTVHLVPVRGREEPTIHEMGIPVCAAEWDQPFHCDVQQRVPMNPNRDATMQGYAAKLHRACLAALLPTMTSDGALAAWVGEAAQSAPEDVQRQVVERAFGAGAVRAVPTTGRFDHNADAAGLGRTVVHTAHMPVGFRRLLQQQAPSAAEVAREAVQRVQERATAASLDREGVLSLDPAGGDGVPPGLRDAVLRIGQEAVARRMDFARWFTEAVLRERHGTQRAVPVRVAAMEALATWSSEDVLTVGIATPGFWAGPPSASAFELLLHEMAHRAAFHHGRSFPAEVEACAGAAAAMMLRRGEEARRLFPWIMP